MGRVRGLISASVAQARMLIAAVLCLIAFHGLGVDEVGAQSPSPRQAATPRGGLRLIRSPKPPYPAEARKKGVHGRVTVRVTVKAGTIVNATATGPELLAGFTAQWIKTHWIFPEDVTGTFILPVDFVNPKPSSSPASSPLPSASPAATALPPASPAATALPPLIIRVDHQVVDSCMVLTVGECSARRY